MMLSEHFSLEEMTRSDTAARHGVPNVPGPAELENLKRTATLMEVVRSLLCSGVHVNSGFRAPTLNALVGGSKTSAHSKGLACDFTCAGYGTTFEVASRLHACADRLQFDQLILEYGWVHIGLADGKTLPRLQRLTKKSATAPYLPGIVG